MCSGYYQTQVIGLAAETLPWYWLNILTSKENWKQYVDEGREKSNVKEVVVAFFPERNVSPAHRSSGALVIIGPPTRRDGVITSELLVDMTITTVIFSVITSTSWVQGRLMLYYKFIPKDGFTLCIFQTACRWISSHIHLFISRWSPLSDILAFVLTMKVIHTYYNILE